MKTCIKMDYDSITNRYFRLKYTKMMEFSYGLRRHYCLFFTGIKSKMIEEEVLKRYAKI